ncbi:MAG: putative ATPase, partial [Mycobacterium sp.]|nr:putative ATPase [Mycobacterium sp.]
MTGDDPYSRLEAVDGEQVLDWVQRHNGPTLARLSGERFEQMRAQARDVCAARRHRMLASMSEIDLGAQTPLVNGSDVGESVLLPTGTVTLLLADVEGSTRLWESQPEEMAQAVAQLDRTVLEVIVAHDGVRPVEQGEGDSFVVAFAR